MSVMRKPHVKTAVAVIALMLLIRQTTRVAQFRTRCLAKTAATNQVLGGRYIDSPSENGYLPERSSLRHEVTIRSMRKSFSVISDSRLQQYDDLQPSASSNKVNASQTISMNQFKSPPLVKALPPLVPRAFDSWTRGLESLCPNTTTIPGNRSKMNQYVPEPSNTHGFLFFKPYKTGSSTTSGVNLRIARNVARRIHGNATEGTFCPCRYDHVKRPHSAQVAFGDRNLDQSFLWTVIRDPTRRAISSFFHFRVSRRGVNATDDKFQSFLQSRHMKDYYLDSLSLSRNGTRQSATSIAQGILNDYNFIGVTERMDESLVVLQFLLGLELDDILYLSAKQKGSYDAGGYDGINRRVEWERSIQCRRI